MISSRAARGRWLVVATVLVVIGEVLSWLLLRSQGNDLGGDQAHYLIAGQALSHLSLHPLPQYHQDFLTHFIYKWPPGASVTNHLIVQTYPGPHGSVFAHGIGLPLLLSPFIAVGSVPLGLVGLFTMTALGFVCIHQRASVLAGLGRSGQLVFALAMTAPALWLAATQVYPDLLSGVLLAMALVEIALVERRRHLSRFGAVVIAGSLAFVPWLQVKNLAPSLVCLIALAVLSFRLRAQRRLLVIAAAVVAAGWILLAAYNQFYFGHLIGLPQPNPTFTLTTMSRTLALLFDAQQGLLVQVPTVVIGLAGLWVGRRLIPCTAIAAIVASVAMLVINGTYTSGVPFGGTDLAGRFQWTVVPMLLAWAPLCLVAVERHRRRLLATGAVIAVLWLFEGVPVLRGDHIFVNSMIAPFAPWDPTVYPGWWPVIGRWLPTFLPPGVRLGATWSHVFFEVAVLAVAFAVIYRLTQNKRLGPTRTLVGATVVAVAAFGLAISLPLRSQPIGPLTFAPANLGAPWSGNGQPITTNPAELATVGPGTYRVTLAYGAAPGSGPASATLMATTSQHVLVSGWFTPGHPTDAARLMVSELPIAPGTGLTDTVTLSPASGPQQSTLTIHVVHQSVLSFYVTVGATSTFSDTSFSLAKVAS